ncbi:restriction endonuclease subunit S [Mycoplasma bradburyae]|uniref:restriction endonuclease subunit S n=1 Tax=Mycoplasma bradburyae TaxID=2963128 RepID=UPI0037097F13
MLCVEFGNTGKNRLFNRKCFLVNKLTCFKPKKINSKYLFYYLSSPVMSNKFHSKKSSMIGSLSINSIKSILIPILHLKNKKEWFL